MNVGHVQGGTHAGWRIVKQPPKWEHICGVKRRELTTYSCPDCGERRP